jgi:hypothetical protein
MIMVIIKKDLIKIETVDSDFFLFITDLLRRIEKRRPDYIEVVEVEESIRTILFISSSYVGANLSRILMEEQQFFWHDQREGIVKVERLPYKVVA